MLYAIGSTRLTGIVVQYDESTGMGILKDAECEEHVFNYTGYLAPDIERGVTATVVRDEEQNDTVYLGG